MSKRADRRVARRVMEQRQRHSAHERELAQAYDPKARARIIAQYEREMRGYILIRDADTHYLCDLGLKDVLRG